MKPQAVKEVVFLFKRKIDRRKSTTVIARQFVDDAFREGVKKLRAASCCFPLGELAARVEVIFGAQQLSYPAEDRVAKPGTKPKYYWARISAFVPSQKKLPKGYERGRDGIIASRWI